MGAQALGASYRDPSGFVYTRDGTLYRQVNRVFQERFRAFLDVVGRRLARRVSSEPGEPAPPADTPAGPRHERT